MKSILSGFLVAALASCFSPPSQAAEANWKTVKNWTIVGDYAGYCRTESYFEGGGYISIGAYKDGLWNLIFADKNAVPMVVGQKYTVQLTTDAGLTGTFTGTAFDPQMIEFNPFGKDAVLTLAKAKTLKVGNFGTFNLAGSAEAIGETLACLQAITSAGAKASSIQKDREA
jgi:hypothetical protein